MTPTIEQAIEIIQQLPPPEREKFFDWAEEEKRRELAEKESKNIELEEKNERFRKALNWIEENKEEYDGKFVVLDGDKLVACGTDSKTVYDEGWARNGQMRNGKQFYGITLPLGPDLGGPLFFAHYSFLGLDPRGLSDTYCSDYFIQNTNHTLINQAYCIRNPKKFVSYSDENWGLTASDNHIGYSAHSPTNDLGVITPTAALSSFPYTPEESMKALKFFYYTLGDRLWGPYGFYDAFNVTQGWTASSYLAIDQGPIVVMIENHRTGLLWDLFMSAPEVQYGLMELGFSN